MNTVTVESIKSKILSVDYYHHNEKVSVCFITMKNGFNVIGKSGVVDKKMFNKETGEKYAYEDAFNQLWTLEGYLLQQELTR